MYASPLPLSVVVGAYSCQRSEYCEKNKVFGVSQEKRYKGVCEYVWRRRLSFFWRKNDGRKKGGFRNERPESLDDERCSSKRERRMNEEMRARREKTHKGGDVRNKGEGRR